MKLIELLVQELPKRGGWPDGIVSVTQNKMGDIYLWHKRGASHSQGYWEHASGNGLSDYWCGSNALPVADEYGTAVVTREQYEAALAAAQQPVWNGEGLPPVGMHCEIVDPDGALMYGQGESGEVVAHVEDTAVIRMSYGLGCFEARCLRPARSETDKKRDEVIDSLAYYVGKEDASDLYDAILAGEVKGVKLDV